jgi:hypothetical protein
VVDGGVPITIGGEVVGGIGVVAFVSYARERSYVHTRPTVRAVICVSQ